MRDKIITLLLILAMVCLLAGCDKDIDNNIVPSTNSIEDIQINEQNHDSESGLIGIIAYLQ